MDTIAFARGVPAPEMIPVDEIRAASDAVLAEDAVRVLSYGTGAGYEPLRAQLAERHGVAPSRIIVTSGSLQGFVLLVQYLKLAGLTGDRPVAVVENPTYDRPLIVLERAGYSVTGVRMDAHGIDPEELDRVLGRERPSLLYLIPTFQNPAGATLAEERRDAVLEVAARHGVLVLEDDPYGRLHFDTPAPRTLFERGSDAEVIYSSSFSKLVSPGLRVGYMVVPERIAGPLAQFANDTYISPTLLGEAIVARLIADGRLEPAIEAARGMLRERCDLICAALDEHLPGARYTRPGGGYFLWADLPGVDDAARVLPIASEKGVTFVAGSAFGPGNDSAVRLAFSSPPRDTINAGIERLAASISGVTAGV